MLSVFFFICLPALAMLDCLFLECLMLNKKTIIIYSIFLYFVPNQLLAEEKIIENAQPSVIINISPLLTKNEQHGQLHVSAIDPEHQLYPVKLISIDGWAIPDEFYGKPILLAEGEHHLKLRPDFSNIQTQTIFMASDWPVKMIAFNLKNEEHLAVAARLIDKLRLQWNVEIYRIDAPIDDISAENPLTQQKLQ